jgi:hypothetical protein
MNIMDCGLPTVGGPHADGRHLPSMESAPGRTQSHSLPPSPAQRVLAGLESAIVSRYQHPSNQISSMQMTPKSRLNIQGRKYITG